MEDPGGFWRKERKLPFREWKEAVIREGTDGTPVFVFVMLYDKENVAILSPEEGRRGRGERYPDSGLWRTGWARYLLSQI